MSMDGPRAEKYGLADPANSIQAAFFDFDLDEFEVDIKKQVEYTTQHAEKQKHPIASPNLPPELRKVEVTLDIDSELKHGLLDLEQEDALADMINRRHEVSNALVKLLPCDWRVGWGNQSHGNCVRSK